MGDRARVYSAHMPRTPRDGQLVDAHAIRLVYEGWVSPDAPAPRVVEVDGSTVEAAWKALDDVAVGAVPVSSVVTEALVDHQPSGRSASRRTPSSLAAPRAATRCC